MKKQTPRLKNQISRPFLRSLRELGEIKVGIRYKKEANRYSEEGLCEIILGNINILLFLQRTVEDELMVGQQLGVENVDNVPQQQVGTKRHLLIERHLEGITSEHMAFA